MALTNEELQTWRRQHESFVEGSKESAWVVSAVDELLVAREQLAHFTTECWDCKETQVCEPADEGDYEDSWIAWYCLDTAACKARVDGAKAKQAAERKAKREARAAKKVGVQ
mgnify:FL=1|jgi:hypothetical protein